MEGFNLKLNLGSKFSIFSGLNILSHLLIEPISIRLYRRRWNSHLHYAFYLLKLSSYLLSHPNPFSKNLDLQNIRPVHMNIPNCV